MAIMAYVSDVHLDDVPSQEAVRRIEILNQVEADYLVMAGDICSIANTELFLSQIKPNVKKVIIVRGNHEYYNTYIGVDVEYPDNFVCLTHKQALLFDDIRFIGDTVWTDIPIYLENDIGRNIYDYQMIKQPNGELITPRFISDLHSEQYRDIRTLASLPSNGRKTVIVTHHSPSFEGVNLKYLGNRINPAFHSNILEEFEGLDISYWIHGHCHDYISYKSCGINVKCSPMGYFGELRNVGIEYLEV